jgi:hypothetical protein
MANLINRISKLTVVGVVFSLMFVTLAHACPSFDPAQLAMPSSSMGGAAGDANPCNGRQPGNCKLVRDAMLSTITSLSETGIFVIASPVPPELFAKVSGTSGQWPWSNLLQHSFHPVFKLQLPVSFLTLRI